MIIRSILDTDLYKLTMQQAILFGRFAGVHFQSVPVTYEFINRDNTPFPPGFDKALNEEIESLCRLQLVAKERDFLIQKLRFLKPGYIDFLSGYRFDKSEVGVQQDGTQLRVTVSGPWYRTVLWEVPLLAIISELYFDMQGIPYQPPYRAPQFSEEPIGHPPSVHENGINLQDVTNRASGKAARMIAAGCHYADFGTRRRRSRDVHAASVEGLRFRSQAAVREPERHQGRFTGTSNVWLAMLNDLVAIGTHAHEWFQAMAALFGYRQANRFALEAWAEEYDGDLGIALSDTFTTDVFFRDFRTDLSKLFDGVRHDSGDPIEFAQKAIAHYKSLNIDPLSKTIVFSDGLNTDKAIEINQWCNGKIRAAFGIGTHFTNDVGVKPLNIVIKMTRCNGMPTVKLSDVEGKYTGQREAIESCKFQLGLNEV